MRRDKEQKEVRVRWKWKLGKKSVNHTIVEEEGEDDQPLSD